MKNIGSTIENIWSIGGEKGWYYANWLWKIRGYMDKFLGGEVLEEAELIQQ